MQVLRLDMGFCLFYIWDLQVSSRLFMICIVYIPLCVQAVHRLDKFLHVAAVFCKLSVGLDDVLYIAIRRSQFRLHKYVCCFLR